MTRGEPFLLLLDSMGGSKDRAVNVIRQYLACEWKVGGWGPEVKIGPEILKFSTFLFRILNPLCPVISSVFLLILLSPFNFKILLYFVPFFLSFLISLLLLLSSLTYFRVFFPCMSVSVFLPFFLSCALSVLLIPIFSSLSCRFPAIYLFNNFKMT